MRRFVVMGAFFLVWSSPWTAMLGVMAYNGPYHDWREARIARQHEAWFAANAKLYTLADGGTVCGAGPTVHMDAEGLYVGPGDEIRGCDSEKLRGTSRVIMALPYALSPEELRKASMR